MDKWRNLHAATHGEQESSVKTMLFMPGGNETNQVLEGMINSRFLTDLRSLRDNPGRGYRSEAQSRDGSLWIEKRRLLKWMRH
jgi:hypothetical protein